MTGRDIIFLSGIDWFTARKLPAHHVVELLSRRNRVFYIELAGGVRRLTLRDVPRALRKAARMVRPDHVRGARENRNGLVVHQPWIVPSPRFSTVNAFLLARGLERMIKRHKISRPVIWTRLPGPVEWKAIQGIGRSSLVYQSVDRYPYSPVIPERLRDHLQRYETFFAEAADVIFASARGLADLKRQHNPNTHVLVNGVHRSWFARPGGRVAQLEAVARPIIGFAGAMGQWLDYPLLREAALLKPEWSFVLLGPRSADVTTGDLEQLPNVHFMGEVAHEELPGWYGHFDCGIIPYLVDEFTAYTFPSKMAEYLAAGLPIVSTPLPELQPYQKVVALAGSAGEFVRAIEGELASANDPGKVEERRHVAEGLLWENIVARMEELIAEAENRGNNQLPEAH